MTQPLPDLPHTPQAIAQEIVATLRAVCPGAPIRAEIMHMLVYRPGLGWRAFRLFGPSWPIICHVVQWLHGDLD